MNNKLKPCPFCGGKAEFMKYEEQEWIQCENCFCCTQAFRVGHDPVKAWNTRTVSEYPVAWRNFDGEGNYDYTDDEETAEIWTKSNGPKYADWCEPLFLKKELKHE